MRALLLGLALAPVGLQAQEPTECELIHYRKVVKVDAMTDAKTCIVLSSVKGTVTAAVTGPGKLVLGVAGEPYPGREEIGIRVGKGKPYHGDTFISGAASQALLSEIRGADTVFTQYVPWPSGARQDGEYAVCDLVDKVDECQSEF
ncbi:hypothetical protein [Pseudoxanthomonas sacheonensis]|uniref:hypothetical protein n=1 Tax=Pseudoxanthomonas sacheonensis TaxID=443615 RepID=UPI0013D37490|nr:hypothetical protein [Pseudoxanthomonas sacheonensis]KAF1706259.1 hypothetical protein CSC73_16260 [Pseudoxanthomonas sacheonensis]